MGEKIRIVGKYSGNLNVELNKPSVVGGNRWIHIQNDKGRLCVSEKEYYMMAAAIIKAGYRLEKVKKDV